MGFQLRTHPSPKACGATRERRLDSRLPQRPSANHPVNEKLKAHQKQTTREPEPESAGCATRLAKKVRQ